MELPEYVTVEEVKRVCSEIGLWDWSKITDPTVSGEEASTILCEFRQRTTEIVPLLP